MTQPRPDQGCSCSRNRKCAFHTAQINKLERVAKPVHDRQKVAAGIEALRRKYGHDEKKEH